MIHTFLTILLYRTLYWESRLIKKERCLINSALFYPANVYYFTMVLPAIVTAPVLANALPSSVAPVLKVMDCIAITVPLKTEVVPNVAELPTCQKMLDANAPPLRITLRPDVVVSVDAICIMKMAFAFPFASKVRLPDDIASEEVDL